MAELDPARVARARERVKGLLHASAECEQAARTHESQAAAVAQIWGLDLAEVRKELDE